MSSTLGPVFEIQNDLHVGSELYWILGIVLPVLFGAIAVVTILVDLHTQLDNFRGAKRQLSKWWEQWSKARDHQVDRNSAVLGWGRRLRSYLWLLFHDANGRYSKYRQSGDTSRLRQKGERQDRLALSEAIQCLDSVWAVRMASVDQLFSDVWAVALRMANRSNIRGFVAGAVAPMGAMTGTILCAQPSDISPWGGWMMYAMLAAVYILCGMVAWGRWSAYAWGCAIVVFIGLNTVELSGATGIVVSRLYDSQTLDILFVCLVTMLTVRQLMRQHSVETCRHGDASDCPSVGAAAIVAARVYPSRYRSAPMWARRSKLALSLCYVIVVGHAVWPAWIELIVAVSRTERLLEVTSVATAGLLVPLVAMHSRGVKGPPHAGGGSQEVVEYTEVP